MKRRHNTRNVFIKNTQDIYNFQIFLLKAFFIDLEPKILSVSDIHAYLHFYFDFQFLVHMCMLKVNLAQIYHFYCNKLEITAIIYTLTVLHAAGMEQKSSGGSCKYVFFGALFKRFPVHPWIGGGEKAILETQGTFRTICEVLLGTPWDIASLSNLLSESEVF